MPPDLCGRWLAAPALDIGAARWVFAGALPRRAGFGGGFVRRVERKCADGFAVSKVRKYLRGERLDTLEAAKIVLNGQYVFLYDRPCHPGFLRSVRVDTLDWFCRTNRLFAAILNPDYKEPIYDK